MGGSRAQVNKAHKTRFSSKSSRNIHKISQKDKNRIAKSSKNVTQGARAARLQRNKMLREQKKAAILKEKRASSGSASPPRVIILFPLSASVNVSSLAEDILRLLSTEVSGAVPSTVASSEYKLRATVLQAPHGDLLSCMEMAKVADLIAFVASATEESTCAFIDSFGSHCLSVFRSLGLPSTVVFIRDLPTEIKRRNDAKKIVISSLTSEFPEDCKFYPADSKDDLHKFMWLFKEQRLTAPHWRNQRPYLMAQKVDLVPDDSSPEKCILLLSGYTRAHSLSVNQLVHVSGAGDFQLSKIEIMKDPIPLNARKDHNAMDSDDIQDVEVIRSLTPDPLSQEPLLVENVPDPLAGEQTWPTEAEMADAERNQKQKRMKKRTLPRGTSEYQAAWIIDDTDEEDSTAEDDDDDDDEDGMVLDEGESGFPSQEVTNNPDFEEDQTSLYLRDSDEETENDSVMMEGENLTREQIEDEIKKIKEAHAEDEEFPDEVDTPLDVPARKRFAKYRGLKSFRTSSWDPKESLPPEYARIFAFDNFARTQKHVIAKALKMEQEGRDDCAPAGSYARLYIKDVPLHVASKLCAAFRTAPVILCGLLQHESKMSVLHFSIKKVDSYDAPIKTKEELIFHVGFRQFVARPIFSTNNINSDKHKVERFLHAGRFSIASIYAPISFPPLPLIVLKGVAGGGTPAIAAVGSLRSVDPDRIILKKIILTGYPQKVSKLKATVRYMFHNPEDVRWFKPVEVWTKCGRRGRVKEPVGTHGSMKCIFNGGLQQHDTVCLSLYKRAYPKWPEHRFPVLNA
ncbi:pre-rRNA-processing protein TSR1 homolog [Hibiscus syriacus]|uniref:pre-rRNA-processing protein TSR1 homolog n=1 Tax=Hibiscus syriacus TaxID=106335 RepID=UPI0019250482|nr:pre-rRNA-processing protein TSR1 homolog [Hibiscus syriacus]